MVLGDSLELRAADHLEDLIGEGAGTALAHPAHLVDVQVDHMKDSPESSSVVSERVDHRLPDRLPLIRAADGCRESMRRVPHHASVAGNDDAQLWLQ